MKVLHILTVVAGFGPLLWATLVATRAKALGGEVGAALIDVQATITRFAQYALGASLLLGFGLSGMSKAGDTLVYGFGEPFIGASTLLLLVALGLLGGLLSPTQKKVAAAMRADDKAEISNLEKLLIPASAGANLCFVVALILMVFKPGS